jgi:hypothetical protein
MSIVELRPVVDLAYRHGLLIGALLGTVVGIAIGLCFAAALDDAAPDPAEASELANAALFPVPPVPLTLFSGDAPR